MRSITLHNLDDELIAEIEKRAKLEGNSLNKTIKSLLKNALGIEEKEDHSEDFKEFFGIWSEEEYQEFHRALKETGAEDINPDDWMS